MGRWMLTGVITLGVKFGRSSSQSQQTDHKKQYSNMWFTGVFCNQYGKHLKVQFKSGVVNELLETDKRR